MAYDEAAARRIGKVLAGSGEFTRKKMFGGICYLVCGNMVGGLVGDTLMVRVGLEGFAEALAQPHARPMDFTGKPLKGFVYVDPPGFATDPDLLAWLERGVAYALSLPPK